MAVDDLPDAPTNAKRHATDVIEGSINRFDRLAKLPADESAFVRVNAETLRSVIDYADAVYCATPPERRAPEFDGELVYMRKRLRTVAL